MIVLLTLFCVALYALATMQVSRRIQHNQTVGVMPQFVMTSAVWLHLAIASGLVIFTPGQPLSLGLVAASITGLMALLLVLSAFFRNLRALYVLAAPVAALALVTGVLIPTPVANQLPSNPMLLLHVLLAITSYAFISIAALMAAIVIIQIRQLRRHKLSRTIWLLPPLQATERLHVELLMIGFGILTVAMAIGLSVSPDSASGSLSKSIATLLGWLVLAVLLFGHLIAGWRGEMAARLTIIGSLVLGIGYFASRFVVTSMVIGS
ncbi:cytochrome C assembly family protein [Salinibius halmophilus]|uniref:cytochrome C assembly family protein n=1 Tax=Salinibius halmophilus TaxID=1853216 RepID=UPI001314F3A8|nr:cytochrome c biogenesis protein CcsA [Salinibius halmophilus]